MLWLMRRPWMKRLEKATFLLVPERFRPGVFNRHLRQNRWARKFGLPILTASMNVFLATVTVSAMYVSAIYLEASGILTPPERTAHLTSTR